VADRRWYVDPNGRLRCTHCRLLATDNSRGKGHSYCWTDPRSGAGKTPHHQIPIALHTRQVGDGGKPMFTHAMEDMLDEESSSRERFLYALSQKSMKLYESFVLNFNGGEKLVEIADRLDAKPSAIRERMRQVRIFYKEWEKENGESA
jgi:hypothetical protein